MKRVLVVLLMAGCGADADGPWNGSVETLPNGAVRVTNPAQGIWEADAGWRLVPELVLGTVDGPEPTVFASVAGIEVDDSGRIYVLDRQANELRIFSADGTHARSVGRSGGGPGEYAAANGLRWISADTLVLVDQRGNRYSILTSEGEYVRSVPRALGFYGWNFNGGYRRDTLYEFTTVGRDDAARPAMLGTSLRSDADRAALVISSDAEAPGRSASVDTAYLPVPGGPLFEAFSVRNERGGMVIGVPFTPRTVYHIDADGDLWHGRGSEFRIFRSSFSGDTMMEILLDAEPLSVTDGELHAWQEGQGVKQFLERGGKLDLDRIPETKPFFDDLLVDPDGHVWVFMPSPEMQSAIAIFDDRGRYLGRVHAEGFRRDTYVTPVVRNGRLYVVGRDDLDVQHVYVFRIEDLAESGVAAE